MAALILADARDCLMVKRPTILMHSECRPILRRCARENLDDDQTSTTAWSVWRRRQWQRAGFEATSNSLARAISALSPWRTGRSVGCDASPLADVDEKVEDELEDGERHPLVSSEAFDAAFFTTGGDAALA